MIDIKAACLHPLTCHYNIYLLDRVNGGLAWKFIENLNVSEDELTEKGIRIIDSIIDRDFYNNHQTTWRMFKDGDL